jgi:cobalt/nickel transport system permease protein
MMIGHLTIAGTVEAVVTGLVVGWLQRTNPDLLETFSAVKPDARAMSRWAWGGLAALILLTPIGLLAPGTAWGEWGREELEQLGLGYIPAGFDEWANFWNAPLPGYDVPLLNNPTIAHVLSAIFGIAVIFGAIFALAWIAGRIMNKPPLTGSSG